jgi:hypothetical protein
VSNPESEIGFFDGDLTCEWLLRPKQMQYLSHDKTCQQNSKLYVFLMLYQRPGGEAVEHVGPATPAIIGSNPIPASSLCTKL